MLHLYITLLCTLYYTTHHLDSFEVYSSSHQICAYQYPYIPTSESTDHILALLLRAACMHNIYLYTVVYQFMQQLLGPVDALNKH